MVRLSRFIRCSSFRAPAGIRNRVMVPDAYGVSAASFALYGSIDVTRSPMAPPRA